MTGVLGGAEGDRALHRTAQVPQSVEFRLDVLRVQARAAHLHGLADPAHHVELPVVDEPRVPGVQAVRAEGLDLAGTEQIPGRQRPPVEPDLSEVPFGQFGAVRVDDGEPAAVHRDTAARQPAVATDPVLTEDAPAGDGDRLAVPELRGVDLRQDGAPAGGHPARRDGGLRQAVSADEGAHREAVRAQQRGEVGHPDRVDPLGAEDRYPPAGEVHPVHLLGRDPAGGVRVPEAGRCGEGDPSASEALQPAQR